MEKVANAGLRVAKCSADDYFMTDDGRYEFDRGKLGSAHGWCQSQAQKALRSGADVVIIDNTNTTYKEMRPYIDMAKKWDYNIEAKVVGEFDDDSLDAYCKRNTHGVPREAIQIMADRFQHNVRLPRNK